MSERHALRIVAMSRSAFSYKPKARDCSAIRRGCARSRRHVCATWGARVRCACAMLFLFAIRSVR